jgi:hypothetical protein
VLRTTSIYGGLIGGIVVFVWGLVGSIKGRPLPIARSKLVLRGWPARVGHVLFAFGGLAGSYAVWYFATRYWTD